MLEMHTILPSSQHAHLLVCLIIPKSTFKRRHAARQVIRHPSTLRAESQSKRRIYGHGNPTVEPQLSLISNPALVTPACG